MTATRWSRSHPRFRGLSLRATGEHRCGKQRSWPHVPATDRALIGRPGLITGPHDPTDGFLY
jgi:hypothetical protein